MKKRFTNVRIAADARIKVNVSRATIGKNLWKKG